MAERTPPLHVMLDLASLSANADTLIQLDSAWTEAEKQGEVTDRDREALLALGRQIDVQFALVERDAGTLQEVCKSYPEWVNQRLTTLLADDRFSDSDRTGALRFLAADDGAFAPRIEALASYIQEGVPAERTDLQEKLRRLRQGGPVVTDMTPGMGCALLGAGALASFAFGPIGFPIAAVKIYTIAKLC